MVSSLYLFLGLFFLFPYLVVPFLVYFKTRQPASQGFDILTPKEIVSLTNPTFNVRVNAIMALGFEPVADLQSIGHPRLPRMLITLLYNRASRDRANVCEMCMYVNGAPAKVSHQMEFTTDFEGGGEVSTNSSEIVGVFAPVPGQQVYRLPGLDDAALLYKIHCGFTAAMNEPKKPLAAKGEELSALQEVMRQSMERQADLGYFTLEESTASYRPTVKGAILMTWKLAWPVGAIRKWHVRQKARRWIEAARAGADITVA